MLDLPANCDIIEHNKMLGEAFDLIGKLSDAQLKTLIEKVREADNENLGD